MDFVWLSLSRVADQKQIFHRVWQGCCPTSYLSAVGDVTAVDIEISDDFSPMTELGYTEKIEDHCAGIYNFFRNDEGLNPHRSYGYLVNPAVGRIIADWWMKD